MTVFAIISDEPLRWWCVFKLPEAICAVPAESERAARAALRETCYNKAPVDEWPLLFIVMCSRRHVIAQMLGHRPVEPSGVGGTTWVKW